MKSFTALNLCLAGCLIGLLGCASTNVTETNASLNPLPKPDRVLVYNFAVSPDEVELDSGLSGEISELMHKEPRSEEERAVGHQVADALANHLVAEIQKLGLPAERVNGIPPVTGTILSIKGQFISINEGNQAERVVIGLGLGRTDVKAVTQAYDIQNGNSTLAVQFRSDAKSGRKPGAAETMGAGAAAGDLATSAVVTAGTTAGSEAFGANVEADADRTAKEITKQLKNFFILQGWIMP
jgi:hypothetical protein